MPRPSILLKQLLQKPWATLVLCALVALGFLVLRGPDFTYSDERDYYELATGLVEDGTFSNAKGEATAYRPPGYPFLLTAFVSVSRNLWWTKSSGVLAIVVACLFCFLLAEKIRPGAGWIAGFLITFYPLAQYTATTLYPQVWAAAFLSGILYLLFGTENPPPWRWAVAGLLYGFLILMAPSFLLLLIAFLGPALLFTHAHLRFNQRLRCCILFAVLAAGVVLPWTYRNYRVFDTFIPVSLNSGVSLLAGNSPGATPSSGVNKYLNERLAARKGLSELEASKAYTDEALNWIRSNPRDAFTLYLGKTANYFNYRNKLYVQSEGSQRRWLLIACTYYPLLALALLRFVLPGLPRATRPEWFILGIYLINAPLSAIFFTRLRFRVPFDMLLVVVAGITVSLLFDRWRSKRPEAPAGGPS